jgi:hypothetical protein
MRSTCKVTTSGSWLQYAATHGYSTVGHDLTGQRAHLLLFPRIRPDRRDLADTRTAMRSKRMSM